jgi:hypothetical protein
MNTTSHTPEEGAHSPSWSKLTVWFSSSPCAACVHTSARARHITEQGPLSNCPSRSRSRGRWKPWAWTSNECSFNVHHWMFPESSSLLLFTEWSLIAPPVWGAAVAKGQLNVPWMLLACSLICQPCLGSRYRLRPWAWTFTECSQNVHWTSTESSLNVHWMFSGRRSLNAHWIFTECSMNVFGLKGLGSRV